MSTKIKKIIANILHKIANSVYTESYNELRSKYFKLRGGSEESYCEECDCFCGCHPCKHTKI